MFGRESKPCKVFEYGCLVPISGEDVMLEQIQGRIRFWNKLVEIERAHRQVVRDELAVANDRSPQVAAELDAVREEIKRQKKASRTGKVDVSDLQEKAKVLKKELTQAMAKAKEQKKRIAEENRERLNEIEAERRKLQKEAQHESKLYWGNYDDIITSYQAARQRAMREGKELKFHRMDGTGKVSIRWSKGLPVEKVFKGDTYLQIDMVPEGAWYSEKRSERRKLARTKVRIRVGSKSPARAPVWLELPMVMHRPLPENGIIRNAAVIRERVGDKFRYKLVITIAFEPVCHKPQGKGAVGIDLGWRRVEGGLRVAYWKDEAGRGGALVLPNRVFSQFEKIDDLKSIREQHFNNAKNVLQTWMVDKKLPDWLKEDTATLSQWRGKGSMVMLIRKWRENRFPGDQEIFAYLEEWVKRDRHLWDWEVNLQDQLGRHRREIYRIFAAEIAKRYDSVFLEDFDLRAVSRKKKPESGTGGSNPPDRQRVIASVSTLRQAIENACRREGVEVMRVQSMHSTTECHICGTIEKFDAAGHIMRTCPKCHNIWDQDENAATVILQRGLSQLGAVLEQK